MAEDKWREVEKIGHILRKNRLLQYVTEERIYGTRTRERRRKQLLDDLKDAANWNGKHYIVLCGETAGLSQDKLRNE